MTRTHTQRNSITKTNVQLHLQNFIHMTHIRTENNPIHHSKRSKRQTTYKISYKWHTYALNTILYTTANVQIGKTTYKTLYTWRTHTLKETLSPKQTFKTAKPPTKLHTHGTHTHWKQSYTQQQTFKTATPPAKTSGRTSWIVSSIRRGLSLGKFDAYRVMCWCIYVCIHVCMCVCIYVSIHVCMCVCMYVCMYVCTYVCCM